MTIEELDTYDLVNAGLVFYHRDRPFEAHEVWEYAWGPEVGLSKLALQAIIQVAAALYKHASGNPVGTSKLFAKAAAKIEEVRERAASWLGIDFVRLAAEVGVALSAADRIVAGESGVAVVRPYLPERTGRDGVLYLHGFASSPSSAKASMIVPAIAARGISVSVPDLNEGDFANLTVSRALALAKRSIRERTVVIGSSLGGYLAALLAEKDERVKGLVLMAPAFDFASGMAARRGAPALEAWKKTGGIEVDHYGYARKAMIRYGLYEDALSFPARPKIRVPTYMLHGRRDELVSPEVVAEVARAFAEVVTFDLVDDDHGLTTSAERARDAALSMIERLGFAADRAPPDPEVILAELDAKD